MTVRLDSIERAIADIAAGKAVVVVDDEDRENEGDLIFAASRATPGADGLHDPAQQRGDLRADAGRHARPARDPPDDPAQPRQDADGLHALRRRPRRRQHRHLGRRPLAHRPRAGRLRDRAVGADPAGPRLPAALPRGRGAGAPRAHRGGGRPRPDGRPDPGGRAGRGRQRRRHHEAGPRAPGVLRRARPGDDLHRGPGAVPPAHRGARRAGGGRPRCRPSTASSRRTAIASASTRPSTSRWRTATSPATSRC